MRIALSCYIALLVVMVSVPAQALEPLVLYDNFNARHIDPDRWFGGEFGGAGREAVRQIQDNRLRLLSRAYGNTDSDRGTLRDVLTLRFSNPAVVTAIEATVQVSEFEVTGCPSNPNSAEATADLLGTFFNTDAPTPGSATNDVIAAIRIIRQPNSTDPKDVLRVESLVLRCTSELCSTFTVLDFDDLGPIRKGEKTRLRIQWDPDSNRFIFQRDDGPAIFSQYMVSDTNSPGLQEKRLSVRNSALNCTTEPRPVAFMEAFFDDVFVNESAAPPNQPPDCSEAVPNPLELWPPNHQLIPVSILGVTDPDGDPISLTITSIIQDEPVNGLGDGNTSPDGAGVGTDTASVRAERTGIPKVLGNGRVYQISFIASDGQGGECQGSVGVCVPHDQRPGHVCTDDGQIYDSTQP